MRELKFRVWDKVDKVCYDNVDIEDIGRVLFLLDDYGHEYVIEQYTGLKDKNGKEIYEGDIVKFDDIDEQAEVSAPAVVVFEYGGFVTKCADGKFYAFEDGDPIFLGRIKSRLYEIIGNIHENPELLEEEE